MTPADQIRDGIIAALTEILQDEDILLDLFAAAALNGLICRTPRGVWDGDHFAANAYDIANSMLKKRREGVPKSRLPK